MKFCGRKNRPQKFYLLKEDIIHMCLPNLDAGKKYLCGVSSKDTGNKITTIMMVEEKEIFHPLIKKLVFDEQEYDMTHQV